MKEFLSLHPAIVIVLHLFSPVKCTLIIFVFAGVLILNLVCRDETIKTDVLKRLSQIFSKVIVKDIEEEVNQIVYAINRIDTKSESKELFDSKSKKDDGRKQEQTNKKDDGRKQEQTNFVSSDISNFLSACVKGSINLSEQFSNMRIFER